MSSLAFDRQIRPVYDALDTGSNKSAIVTCNKLLKKYPKNELVRALKALALIRSQKVEESLVLCDEILESKPTNDAVLTAMMHVLRGLGRHKDMVTMFEEAYKQQPTNEELGAQTFFANVRAGHWKSAQLISTRMYKQFQEDRYLYWSVISAVLQANDSATPSDMRTLLYNLAHRLINTSPTPSFQTADRFHLHLSILRELGHLDEAHKLLDTDVGKSICATSLSCNEIRRDIWRMRGLIKDEGLIAEKRIVEHKDRNWLEFISLLDATLANESTKGESTLDSTDIENTRRILRQISEEDGHKDRSAQLALLELEKRAGLHKASEDPHQMVILMQQYFGSIGDKACCFEDMKPYLNLGHDELSEWTTFLQAVPASFVTPTDLRRFINAQKLLRYNLTESELTVEAETDRVKIYIQSYFEGLPLGKDLPSTELQHADDLALLAANGLISLWTLSTKDEYLWSAASLLEFALTKSKHAFSARLLLVRIYRLLGAPGQALDHFRGMHIKQVQRDTLSHFALSRASTFSAAASGDLTYVTECIESTQIYLSNSQETGDFVVRAFTSEKYSQIPEFIAFEERLDNSLQRDIVKMEHLRMRLTHEPINSDIIDMELIELKFIFDRIHHDNRDFAILGNYQPQISKTLNEQTLLFGNSEGLGWLWTFLKVYIRAFQQASDLDDSVEEKLLIGDRPKQCIESAKRLPLKERLCSISKEDIHNLTPDEFTFVEFASALADWLQPYHDYARPPPAVVLAEAAKQTELKTGHPLKGVEIPSMNGSGNGHTKKDEEPPVVSDPPELIIKYFDNIKARFDQAQQSSLPSELLHVAALAQESFLLLVVETVRFKSSSLVKMNKFGSLVSSFKEIRSQAIDVLKSISAALIKRGEAEGTADQRKAFVDGCSLISASVDHDFILGIAKKVQDSRKKVLESVGKGMGKIYSSYAN